MDIQTENMALKAKLRAIEQKAKDLLTYVKRPQPIYESSIEYRINQILKETSIT